TVTLSFDSTTGLTGGNTALVDSNGDWTVAVDDADITNMGEGSETITATQTDDAGNESASVDATFVVDTQALAPSINAIAIDNVVNDDEAAGGISITGTGEAGATVNLVFGNGITLAGGNSALVGGTGNWSVAVTDAEVSAMGEGAETVAATQTDEVGNVSVASGAHDFTVDTTAPTATLNSTSTKAQSSEVGTAYLVKSTVAVTSLADILGADDSQRNNVAITAADTDTAISMTGLDEGDYVLYTVDAAGNLSEVSANSATVDHTAPTVAISDNTAGTATGAVTYTFTFSEAVSNFTVADVSVTGGTKASSFARGADGSSVYTLVVTPPDGSTANLIVNVASGVAQDAAGNNNTAAARSVQAVETFGGDSSIVVFDLVHGVSSSHNGGSGADRTFETNTEYTIYIMVDSDSAALHTTWQSGADNDASWGKWKHADRLGDDDRVILVGDGSSVKGPSGRGVVEAEDGGGNYSYQILWGSSGGSPNGGRYNVTVAASLRPGGGFHRSPGRANNWADLWTRRLHDIGLDSGAGADLFANSIPGNTLTSQGLV
ncbi:MAG: hypothetical protein ACJAWL_002741, partial [Motiliproteus sp.]